VSNFYSRRCNDRRVDPCRGGLWQGFGRGPDKAFRVACVDAVQDLLALLDDHRAVEIEDQARPMFGQVNEMLQQSVVDAMYLLQKWIGSLEQETA